MKILPQKKKKKKKKMKKFRSQNSDIHISAQNIDCGAEIGQVMYTPVNPNFTI